MSKQSLLQLLFVVIFMDRYDCVQFSLLQHVMLWFSLFKATCPFTNLFLHAKVTQHQRQQFYDLEELFRKGGQVPDTSYIFMVSFVDSAFGVMQAFKSHAYTHLFIHKDIFVVYGHEIDFVHVGRSQSLLISSILLAG